MTDQARSNTDRIDLPSELWLQIFQCGILKRDDNASISLTNRQLRRLAQPLLFLFRPLVTPSSPPPLLIFKAAPPETAACAKKFEVRFFALFLAYFWFSRTYQAEISRKVLEALLQTIPPKCLPLSPLSPPRRGFPRGAA